MTGLWTNDRNGLAAWLSGYLRGFCNFDADDCGAKGADALISMRVVRVLDPDDTELVDHAAKAVYDIGLLVWTGSMDDARRVTRAVIEALRQP
jgi:hypothetical protein